MPHRGPEPEAGGGKSSAVNNSAGIIILALEIFLLEIILLE